MAPSNLGSTLRKDGWRGLPPPPFSSLHSALPGAPDGWWCGTSHWLSRTDTEPRNAAASALHTIFLSGARLPDVEAEVVQHVTEVLARMQAQHEAGLAKAKSKALWLRSVQEQSACKA